MTAGPEPGLHPAILYHVVNTLGWAALHPLQEAAVEPIAAGQDVLLLAPTAGGKTEAALFPVLSRIAAEDWRGLTVLYVCPLRALLNNLEPRVAGYASWLGRRAALWHGDTPTSARRRLRADRPDLLLTTPESLEAMLVSTLVTPREMFGDLRSVIVDEVHAFAGDDRGWHLLAVLERVSRVAGRPLQRVGLSATVGNRPNCRVGCRGRRAGTARPACSTRSPGTVVASTCNLTTSAPSGTRPRSSLRCTPARNGWPSPSPAAGSRNSPVDVVDQPVPAGEREYTRALDSPGQPRGVDGAHVLDPAPPGARPWGATDQPQVSVVVAVKLVDAVRQLNFAEMLPTDLARATLAARAADTLGAAAVAGRAIVAR